MNDQATALQAQAALISWDPATNAVTADPFSTATGSEDPVRDCHALKASIEADWPERLFTVIADDSARKIRSDNLVDQLFGKDETR